MSPDFDIDAEAQHGTSSADYVLRTAQQNLVQMSALADQKASVVLASAFVAATIVFGDVAGSAELDALRISMLVTAVLSGILAAVALAPRFGIRPTKRQPLFFGSIAQMDRDEYREVMSEMLSNDRLIYETIVDDLHAASRVLVTSKYRPLQYSYLVLVVGMTATLGIAVFS